MFRPRSIGLLLAFATLVIYLPATFCQFINFDDPDYFTENPVIQNGLTWAGVKWAFTGAHAANWHPLTWLSHMTDADLFGMNPGGPHLVNVVFHAFNAALLFILLFRLTKNLWPSVFIAALFAWHPLHVESVAWISERKDVLSTFFVLLTLLSYTRYAQENYRQSFWYALFFFVLALLSKPMPVTLPLVMLLLDYWPLKRIENYRQKTTGFTCNAPSDVSLKFSIFWEKWPFFLVATISCIVTFLAQHDALNTLQNVPMGFRLVNALTAYGSYLWKMIWPVNLAMIYPLHSHIAWQLIAWSAIILAGVSVLAWRERKDSPWLMVGWLWFLITLLPVIGLIQVGSQAMADRYSYFPIIGIFVAITFSAQAISAHFGFLRKSFVSAAVLILGICIALTENQLRYWHDSESLFAHSLTVIPSEQAYLCVGIALNDQKRSVAAMNQFIMAWRLNPQSALANGNIGYMLNEEGKTALAAIYYQKALEQKPRLAVLYKNYGMLLDKLGRFDEAMSQFSAAEKLDPTDADPVILIGNHFLTQGRDVEALKQFHKAMQLDPNNLQLVVLTANLLAAATDPLARNGAESYALAENLLKQTGSQQPVALDTLAMADAEIGKFEEAVKLQQKAIKIIETTGSQDDLQVMQNRLEAYQNNQPWRESFKRTFTPQKLTPR
jgi:tetratricopeptide (TPR) repeat protein